MALVSVLAIFMLFFLLDVPSCPSRFVVGIPCPGCGFTRATSALLHGELLRAWSYHPLVFLLFPLLCAITFQEARRAFKPTRPGRLPRLLDAIPGRGWLGIGLLMIAVWVLRLLGYLGGHPDGIVLSVGMLGRLFS